VGLYAVTVIGKDRPGVVADVTRALVGGGAIGDSPIISLGGYLAMTLVVSAGLTAETLGHGLTESLPGLAVGVTDLHRLSAGRPGGDVMEGGNRTGLLEEVVTAPHDLLVTPAATVDPTDVGVAEAAGRLLEAMRSLPDCRGLTAPQLGVGWRLMCLDVSGHPLSRSCSGELVIANPEIVEAADWVVAREGCLSVPGLAAEVARAAHVTIQGVRPGTGEPLTIRANAFEARCVQHQIDHLDGLLFLDRVAGPVPFMLSGKGDKRRKA
jgi:peptide deformylase